MTESALATAAAANTGAAGATALAQMVPVDPFRALYVHFGMLLGVDDFRTQDAYHRGKMWFHSSWLHREGVLWGLRVGIDQPRGEIRVEPGAALDALGHELYLAQAACLNLGDWFNQHRDDPLLAESLSIDEETGAVRFDAHVAIQFRACLNRQVPALSEPCDGSNASTAYSRVNETVELKLLPGLAPAWRATPGALPFHRVRLLFGLETAITNDEGVIIDADQEVLDQRATILALAAADQPAAYLAALRRFSALDQMEMTPAQNEADQRFSLFPALDPTLVPLADLHGLTLLPGEAGWVIDGGVVDNGIRPVHLPTSTIQELVCGPVMTAAAASPTPPPSDASPVDAGGPRIDPASVTVEGEVVRMTTVGAPLMKASVDVRGLSVTAFDIRDGWINADVKKVSYDEAASQLVIELRDDPGGNLVRLIVHGTGAYPFLGRNRIPLAGAVGGPAGFVHNGNDFVAMVRVRS